MSGRNEPCPCGSGKKYKKCCGSKRQQHSTVRQGVDLPGAIASFENGNYPMAISMAESFLKQYPKEPVAWQVLGVSRYFLHDLVGAEQAFNSLLKYDKRNPDALNNLGLVLSEQGRFEQAEDYCKKALKINPNMPGAHNNLGNIYRARGLQNEAEQSYRKAIKQGMQTPEIWCNLGTVLQEQGHNDDARDAYDKALALDDRFVAAHSNLGGLLLTELKLEEAWRHLQRAEHLAPDDIDVLNALGNYYHETGELEKAEASFGRALEVQPNNPEVNYRAGFYYLQLCELDKAVIYLKKAVQLDPNHAKALAALGQIYDAWVKRRLAEQCYEKAIAFGGHDPIIVKSYCGHLLKWQRHKEVLPILQRIQQELPDNPTVQLGLAEYYARVGDYESADQCYEKLMDTNPDEVSYYCLRAEMDESRHQLEAAIDFANQAIKLEPENLQAHTLLARIYARQKKYHDALAIYAQIGEFNQNKEKQYSSTLLFEKGKLLDKLKDYDEAYNAFVVANNIKTELICDTYNHDGEKKKIESLKKIYSRTNVQLLPKLKINEQIPGLTPIFIVGFPRSGTTLLEQILTSHSKVSAGDELIFLEEVSNRVALETGSKQPHPECMLDPEKPVTQETLLKLRLYYHTRVMEQGFVAENSTMFTDKMPHNLLNLGLIWCLFPDAPVIHITRHPMDACLSAFMANFTKGHRYTATMEDTARHYARLMDLVEHYKSQLDMNYLEIRYEDLVDNTEVNAYKVIDFVGLPWEDACLRFYESKRVSRTASYAQVTEKIYTSSRYRYKNYYKHMVPLEPILHDSIQRFGYTFEP